MIILVTILVSLLGGIADASCICPATVTAMVEQSGRETVYRYTVINRGDTPVNGIFLGVAAGHEAELDLMPRGCEAPESEVECGCRVPAPLGWTGCVGLQEESNLHFLQFRPESESEYLAPGEELVIEVYLSRADRSYEKPMFWAIAERGCSHADRVSFESRD